MMSHLLLTPQNSLIHQSLQCYEGATVVNGDGFGVGWYSDKVEEPGVYKDHLPAWNDANLNSLVTHIESKLFFAHIRATTGTPSSRVNCHPFRYNDWLFMHNGSIAEFTKIRYQIEQLISPEFFSLRQGGTDTEALFLVALSLGLESNPIKALTETLSCVRQIMRENEIDGPLRASFAVSNGKDIYTLRYSNTESCPSLYYTSKIVELKNQSLEEKSWIIVSEPLDQALHNDYEEIENGTLLHFSANGSIEKHYFKID